MIFFVGSSRIRPFIKDLFLPVVLSSPFRETLKVFFGRMGGGGGMFLSGFFYGVFRGVLGLGVVLWLQVKLKGFGSFVVIL